MESGAFRSLDAMRRPGPTKFLEVLRLPRMPVPREQDGQMTAFEERNGSVHPRNDCVPVWHTERPTWAKVVLDVDDEQRRLWSHRSRPRHPGDSLKGCGLDETLEIRDVVLPKREVCGQSLKPPRLPHVGTRTRVPSEKVCWRMRVSTGSVTSKPTSSRTSRRKPSTVVSPSSRRPPGVSQASPQPAAAT